MSNLVVHKGLTNQQVSKVLNLSHKRHGRVTTESYFNLIHTKNNRKSGKPIYPYWLLQVPFLKTNWIRTTDDQIMPP